MLTSGQGDGISRIDAGRVDGGRLLVSSDAEGGKVVGKVVAGQQLALLVVSHAMQP